MTGTSFNFFSIIKLLLVIVAAVLFISATISVMTDSRNEWQEYYDNLMDAKENEKYQESLPLVFESISVELNEGVAYYDNGKASVKKEDLLVTAYFSEKGKITEQVLEPSEFEMTVPEGFAIAGGKVTVKYIYQPEAEGEDAEAPSPISRVAEIDIPLTPVTPTSLKIIDNPYRVYYSEDMTFDPTGIQLEAVFNTGDKVVINENDISFGNVKLAKGTDSIKVSYTKAGVTVDTDVQITVKSAAEYTDGEIESISTKGQMCFVEGQNVSAAKMTVIATHESGNRFVLSPDEYTVSANVERASLTEKCIFNISLNANPDITCSATSIVRLPMEAEKAVLVGAGQKTVEVDGVSVTLVENFADGSTMTFAFNSNAAVKGQFSIRVANNGLRAAYLSGIISMKVNGRSYIVPSTSVLPARSTGSGYNFIDVPLTDILLNEGNNVVELVFNNVENASIAIDSLSIVNVESKLTVGEYLVHVKDNDADANPTVPVTPAVGYDGKIYVNVDKETSQLYSMGGVSDGKYLYVSMNGDQHLTTVISKIDPETYTVVAQTAVFNTGEANENNSRLFILDDTLYCIIQNGKIVEISLDKFEGFGYEVKNSTLSFANYGTVVDATWNESAGRIAIITAGRKLHILNGESAVHEKIQTASLKNNVAAYSVASDDKFVYVSYETVDGSDTLQIDVFTWDGEKVGSIDATGFVMDSETTFNVQAIYMHEGQLYAAVSSWGTRHKNGFFAWKIDVDMIGLGS